MSKLPERIRQLRTDMGLTQEEFGKLAGVKTRAAVSQWEKGRTSPQRDALLSLEKNGIDIRRLLADDEQPPHLPAVVGAHLLTAPLANEYVLIPRYDHAHSETKCELAFRLDWMQRMGLTPGTACLVYAAGESMTPAIHQGGLVLIDMSKKELRNGKVFAFLIDNEVRIKRVFKPLGGQDLCLSSDNDNKRLYPDEVLQEAVMEVIRVLGQCVWQGSAL